MADLGQLTKDLATAWARKNWKEIEEAAQAILAVEPENFTAAKSRQTARIERAAQEAPVADLHRLRDLIYNIRGANLLVRKLDKS